MTNEESLDEKIRNLLREKEVSFCVNQPYNHNRFYEQWFIDTTEDEVLEVIKNFIIDEFSKCTENK